MTAQRHYTCREAAAILGTSPRSVQRAVRKHGLGMRLGRAVGLTAREVSSLRLLIHSGPGRSKVLAANGFGQS